MSVVGFRFLRTRGLGIPIPFHRDFEELNLRLYVRRRAEDGWRRAGGWEGLSTRFSGEPEMPGDDAEETFITEHYWGYARQRDGATVEPSTAFVADGSPVVVRRGRRLG